METNMERKAVSKHRFERKFAVEGLSPHALKAVVKLHPALFREVFVPRRINNIYLDGIGLKAFYENTSGISQRKKVRIRWYGDLLGYIAKPVLEHKIKSGMLGTKSSWQLPPFTLDDSFDSKKWLELVLKSDLPAMAKEELLSMAPILLNSYYRTYYVSADKNFRITVDEDLQYYGISAVNNYFVKKRIQKSQLILELKYPAEKDDEADRITQHFPFRLTKSSKYVNGVNYNRALIAS